MEIFFEKDVRFRNATISFGRSHPARRSTCFGAGRRSKESSVNVGSIDEFLLASATISSCENGRKKPEAICDDLTKTLISSLVNDGIRAGSAS